MEPFIVIVKEIKNDKIILTEKELKQIIKQAYNEGYSEGNKKNWWNYPITYSNNTIQTSPNFKEITTNTPLYTDPNIQITCEAHNGIGD